MKYLVIAIFAFAAFTTAYAQTPFPNDTVVIRGLLVRAQAIIIGAETELEKHWTEGRRALTVRFEAAIEEVRITERELVVLEFQPKVDKKTLHQYEERLLRQENFLIEEGLYIANQWDELSHENGTDRQNNEKITPAIIIGIAQILIRVSEDELILHYNNGVSRNLTLGFEAEIEATRILVRELQAIEQNKVLNVKELHEYDQRLLHAENRLSEEALFIKNRHDELTNPLYYDDDE